MEGFELGKVNRGSSGYSYAPGQRIKVGIPVKVDIAPEARRSVRWQDKVKIVWREALVTQVYPQFRFRYPNQGTEHKLKSGMYLSTDHGN